jgi:hypothetical protein
MLDPQSTGNWMVLDSIMNPDETVDSFIVDINKYVDAYPAAGLDRVPTRLECPFCGGLPERGGVLRGS